MDQAPGDLFETEGVSSLEMQKLFTTKTFHKANMQDDQSPDGKKIKVQSMSHQDLQNQVFRQWSSLVQSCQKNLNWIHPSILNRNVRFQISFKSEGHRYSSRSGLPKGLEKWSLQALENCLQELSRGSFMVEAYAIHPSPPDLVVPQRDDSTATAKSFLYEYCRARLKRTIETMVGRLLIATGATQHNHLKDDLDPPHLFEWVFSGSYEFPNYSLSQFEKDDLYDIIEALETGNLWVRSLRTHPLDPREPFAVQEISQIAKNGIDELAREAEDGILDLIQEVTGQEDSLDNIPEILAGTSVTMQDWSWKFTDYYPCFNVTKHTSNRNHILRGWSAKPIIHLLLAIKLENLSLVPKTNLKDQQNLLPRKITSQGKPASYRDDDQDSVRNRSWSQASYSPMSVFNPRNTMSEELAFEESPIRGTTRGNENYALDHHETPQIPRGATNNIFHTAKHQEFNSSFIDNSTSPDQLLQSIQTSFESLQASFLVLSEKVGGTKPLEEENQKLKEWIYCLEEQTEDKQSKMGRMQKRIDDLDVEIDVLERKVRKVEKGRCLSCSTSYGDTKRRKISLPEGSKNESQQPPNPNLSRRTMQL